MIFKNKTITEAKYFAQQNNEQLRKVSWSSIKYFQNQLGKASNLQATIASKLGGNKTIRGLSLAGGDLTGEYQFLKRAGATSIDAYDISEGQRDKFYSRMGKNSDIEVNYYIEDVNKVNLKENHYDIVYIQQAYHHFEEVERIAQEINKSLKSEGLFVIIDYIGPNFLQRSEAQKKVCRYLWKNLPKKYRTDITGRVRDDIHIPEKDKLSPYEAVRSEDIMDTLNSNFKEVHKYLYGAILFPLINCFAHNYTDSEEDQRLLKELWDLDRLLIETGLVEPNFIRAIFVKNT